MEFDRRTRYSSTGGAATHDAPTPGKETLTQGLVQMHPAAAPTSERSQVSATPTPPVAAGPRPTLQTLFGRRDRAQDPDQVHAAAARGTATAATQLPHIEQIQRSFGRHDVSGVQAHVGAEATASAQEMGAAAFATGNHVVLGAGTDLHTVAHEAAHVVQQRGGVQLKGGVGEVGDTYERQADEVADAVVRGESAEALLDRGATTNRVQQAIQFVRDGTHAAPLEPEDIQEAFDTYAHPSNVRMIAPSIYIGDNLHAALQAQVEIVTVGVQPRDTYVDIRRGVNGEIALRVSEVAELTSLEAKWIAVMDELGQVAPFVEHYDDGPYHAGDPESAPSGDRLDLSAWAFRARNRMDIEVHHSGDMTFTAADHAGEQVCEFVFSIQDYPNRRPHIWLQHMESNERYRRQGIAKRVMQIAWNALGGFQVPYGTHTPDPSEYYLTTEGQALIDYCLRAGILPLSSCGLGEDMNLVNDGDEQHSDNDSMSE